MFYLICFHTGSKWVTAHVKLHRPKLCAVHILLWNILQNLNGLSIHWLLKHCFCWILWLDIEAISCQRKLCWTVYQVFARSTHVYNSESRMKMSLGYFLENLCYMWFVCVYVMVYCYEAFYEVQDCTILFYFIAS